MPEVIKQVGEAVRQSRFTDTELAEQLGIHRTTLNRYLNGHLEMPAGVLIQLLGLLGMRLTDLLQDGEQPKVLFRSDDPTVVKEPFYNHTLDKLRFYEKSLKYLQLSYLDVELPRREDVSHEDSDEIQDAALETRRVLHLPERGPVIGLFFSLSRTVKIVGFTPTSVVNCDGFAVSSQEFGLGIAINTANHFERQLSSIAHELGHIVLHRDAFASADAAPKSVRATDPREKAAWAFTGRFLLPSTDLRDLFAAHVGKRGGFVPPYFINRVKKYYGLSADMVLQRLREEKYIDGKMYGYLKHKVFYKNQSKEELHRLTPQECSAFGQPQEHFDTMAARMYFAEEATHTRVAELVEKSLAETETWLSKKYELFGSPLELAN